MEVEDSSSSDEDDFHPVNNRKRKKASLTIAEDEGKEQNLLNNNKFGSLADKNNNNNNAAPAVSEATPEVPAPCKQPGKQKQPPLVVKNTSFTRLMTIMSRCDVKPVYKLTKFGININCFTVADFEKSRAHLEKNKVEYYTFQRRNERPHRVVLRGVPVLEPEQVKNLLKDDQKLDVLEVYAIKRKEKSAVETPYIVLFPKGYTNLNKLRSEVKKMGPVIVRWEAYRNRKPHVVQCKNCLHLGHGAINCHLKGRCNNCGRSHKTESCKDHAVRCANCAGSHSATDPGCPKRVEIIKSRQQASKTKTSSSAVPAFTTAEFPPLQKAVPVDKSKSAHPQPGAAPGSGQRNGVPRGGAASKGEAGEALYSSEELWSI